MIPDLIIDDNFLSPNAALHIEKEIIYGNKFTFNPGEIVDGNFPETPAIVFGDMFEDHPFFTVGTNEDPKSSPILNLGLYLLDTFCKKHKLEVLGTGRVKSNLTPISLSKKVGWPHVDDSNAHYVFLYYVNDSDGDTVIYENEYNGKVYKQEDLIVMESITPKAGKAILFNGKFFHGITPPQKTNYRCVVNINLKIKEKE